MTNENLAKWGIVAGVVLIGLIAVSILTNKVDLPLGVSVNEPNFYGVTNSSTTCPIGNGGLIVATNTARLSFSVNNQDSTSTWLCRDSICPQGGGRLLATGGNFPFEQTDGYTGPYGCSSAGSSTVNYWSK